MQSLIEGPKKIRHILNEDQRGNFRRIYGQTDIDGIPRGFNVQQINESYSKLRGTIRGLHFQLEPDSETKIIRVIKGRIYDVAVNVRKFDINLGKLYQFELTDEDLFSLLIPPGYAHGFQTLDDDTRIEYLTNANYNRELERTLLWNDPEINIPWPKKVTNISRKDQTALSFANIDLWEVQS